MITRSQFRHSSPFLPYAVGLAILLLSVVTGCGSARAGRLVGFSGAGTAYTPSRSDFLRQSLQTTIDRDTLELRKQRTALDPAGRIRVLSEHDAIMRERIEIVQDLDRHGQVLRQYFAALSRLASSREDANAAAAATRLSGELGGLTNSLAAKSINGNPLNVLLGQATGLAVGTFRNRELSRHLSANASTIERALLLEEDLLRVLTEEMIADLKALQSEQRRSKVLFPFRDNSGLPEEWEAERARILFTELDIGRASAAQDAARQLRLTYESLAAGDGDGPTGDGVLALQFAVSRLSDFVGNLSSSQARNH